MTVAIHIDIDDRQVQQMLQRLIAFGNHPADAMADIATYGESSTRQRFADQAGPDGNAWLPSQRVQERGGKTLIQDRHLLDSIVSNAGADFAEWGSDVIYAAIHQFGGEIVPKSAESLFFRLPDGTGRRVKKVTIPARPYLGFNDDDEANIIDIINNNLADMVGNP
ncbi:MAG: phage virion morphogenesis protein [Burkholderiales bacterium]|nr:phage virion morphogenesis protein [Burkholderiales bacterium]